MVICSLLLGIINVEARIGGNMKKVIVINGSQSKRGCSRSLVDKVVEYIQSKYNAPVKQFKETVDASWNYEDAGDVDYSILYFDLKKLTYKGCIDCGYCEKHKGCMLRDDIKYMYRYFDEADYVIFCSPVYFDGTPAHVKGFIDRTQAIYHSKYTLMDSLIDRSKKRFAMNILVGGEIHRDSQFVGIRNVLEYYYRAINTTPISYVEISNTDRENPFENEALMAQIIANAEELLGQNTEN